MQGSNLAGMGGSAGYYMHGRPLLGGDPARPQQPRSHSFPFAYAAGGCYWAVPVVPTGAYACPAYQARACRQRPVQISGERLSREHACIIYSPKHVVAGARLP